MRILFLVAAALAVVLFGGCDSGDPVDQPEPEDVAGVYHFTEYTFQPSGTAFQPIVVLDTLDNEETNLWLSSDGDFILFYRFVSGQLYFPSGNFEVRARAVSLSGSDEDADRFTRLLLDRNFTLRRDPDQPDVLTAEIPKTIDPSAFSDRYAGVESMSGTLRLRLERD